MARCPAWAVALSRAGPPRFANLAPYMGENVKGLSRAAFIQSQAGGAFDWAELERVRGVWPGKLVLKGLLAPADVAEAAALGVDGVMVSNHGGRQVDAGPVPIEMVPEAVEAVEAAAGCLDVMLDGGVRRGADVVRLRALGGSFAFVGRAPLYGLAAGGGQRGCDKALGILVEEIDRMLAQLGCNSFSDLDRQHLKETTWAPFGGRRAG